MDQYMKLENLLKENMHRFKTKNLTEDMDQNNNGYPDGTESNQKPAGRYTADLLAHAAQIMNVASFDSLYDAYEAMADALDAGAENEDEIRDWVSSYARYGKY
jgi:hypothetical protein